MIRRITSAVCQSAAAANGKFCPGLQLAGWVGDEAFAAVRAQYKVQSGFLNQFGLKANHIS